LTLVTLLPGIEQEAQLLTARSLGAFRLLGAEVEVSGTVVSLGGTAALIVPECTSLIPTILYGAAIVAFPSTWLWRLEGIFAGAAILWLYNVARIGMLALLRSANETFAKFMHLYLWQTITLVLVLSLFVAWVRLQPRRPLRP